MKGQIPATGTDILSPFHVDDQPFEPIQLQLNEGTIEGRRLKVKNIRYIMVTYENVDFFLNILDSPRPDFQNVDFFISNRILYTVYRIL